GATATQDMTFEALGFSTLPTGVPDATVGTAYNFSFDTGNLQGVLFYLTGGSLPTGLTLNNNGTITGTPSGTPGSTLFTVTIRDVALNECSQDFVIAIQASGGGGGGIGAWTFVSSLNEGGSQNNNSGNIITFSGGVWNSTMSAPFPFPWTSGVCQIILTNTSATNRTFVVSAVASVTNWNCDAVANAQILINPANLDPATVYSGGLSGSVSFLVGPNSIFTVSVAVDFGAFFSTAVAGATGTITLSAA
ncbi:MAG TPA: putative Ig domain-containing protein, partial [Terracidiphilus sp.]|nr:putative Ig domain-containing protein [Terracidiphilus sp.]